MGLHHRPAGVLPQSERDRATSRGKADRHHESGQLTFISQGVATPGLDKEDAAMSRWAWGTAVLIAATAVAPVGAADDFRDIFDGKTLNGWVVEGAKEYKDKD